MSSTWDPRLFLGYPRHGGGVPRLAIRHQLIRLIRLGRPRPGLGFNQSTPLDPFS